jgi:hypothetical protein
MIHSAPSRRPAPIPRGYQHSLKVYEALIPGGGRMSILSPRVIELCNELRLGGVAAQCSPDHGHCSRSIKASRRIVLVMRLTVTEKRDQNRDSRICLHVVNGVRVQGNDYTGKQRMLLVSNAQGSGSRNRLNRDRNTC